MQNSDIQQKELKRTIFSDVLNFSCFFAKK